MDKKSVACKRSSSSCSCNVKNFKKLKYCNTNDEIIKNRTNILWQKAIAFALNRYKIQERTIRMDIGDMETCEGPNQVRVQCINNDSFEFYTKINKFYMEKANKVSPLQSDESMKKYRTACQKAINMPLNSISAATNQHLQGTFEKLYSFMSGNRKEAYDGYNVSVDDHPLGRDYCTLFLARQFISQGDVTISGNAKTAFPIASVIVSLWKLIPEFGQLFLAKVFKESPFLVPVFIPQKRGQSVHEYLKILGYKWVNGVLENQNLYLKRQSGIARLYFAVMVTAGRSVNGPEHPYGIENGWKWISNFITLDPLPEICATLLLEFIENAGAPMLQKYENQFHKLLLGIRWQYLQQQLG